VFRLAGLSRIDVPRLQIDALLQANLVLGVHLLEAIREVQGCRLINLATATAGTSAVTPILFGV
jgi:hypothetical protein